MTTNAREKKAGTYLSNSPTFEMIHWSVYRTLTYFGYCCSAWNPREAIFFYLSILQGPLLGGEQNISDKLT